MEFYTLYIDIFSKSFHLSPYMFKNSWIIMLHRVCSCLGRVTNLIYCGSINDRGSI